ncbi:MULTISPECIES: hypothetical protein [unclassified Nitrobacter]|uniref:hypothetical protein n=1 Tax=unclassified Nitrobacter TaxID=2620411 RepID=UPI0025CE25E7|nr:MULTISPECIES: hypothetical protein [unclassified Nitrobacter]
MNSSEDGRCSQETSVIMATIVEVALRRLTDRPTVARAAAGDIRPAFRIPTRACDPRTEITRPNELAEVV